MRNIEEIKANTRLSQLDIYPGKDGYVQIVGRIKFCRWEGSVIFDNADGVEHVSISPYKKSIIPNWFELVETKRIFWKPDEEVVQIIPKDSEYVNIVKNCMHLWRAHRDKAANEENEA